MRLSSENLQSHNSMLPNIQLRSPFDEPAASESVNAQQPFSSNSNQSNSGKLTSVSSLDSDSIVDSKVDANGLHRLPSMSSATSDTSFQLGDMITGIRLINWSEQATEAHTEKEKETRLKSAYKAPHETNQHNPLQTYQSNLEALTERYGADLDLPRADFMICSTMAKQGFTSKQLIETLEKVSPELPTRKASHELDYCQRTVEAACANPKVQEHLSRSKSQ